MAAKKTQTYGASSITVLEGLEAVRKRPGMYIGSTGERGLHHLVQEVVDNSVDEALAGYCDTIDVTLLADGGVRVMTTAAASPSTCTRSRSARRVEVVLTTLHAGGKFGGKAYAVSGGLHGVGVSVVNALSSRLEVEIKRDGYTGTRSTRQRQARPRSWRSGGPTSEHGTTVTFWADPEIFETTDVLVRDAVPPAAGDGVPQPRPAIIAARRARRGAEARSSYQYKGGIADFVRHLNATKDADPQVGDRVRRRGRRHRGRGRDAVERDATASRSTPSPTRSTRTRAARTRRASAPR